MCALDPQTASRLAKICGRFGSDFKGERANAALLATRTLKAAGVTWDDVFSRSEQALPSHAKPTSAARHIGYVKWALGFPQFLTSWETGFLRDLARRRSPTAKQAAKLAQIIENLHARGAA
jgi:hypothetical protein